MNITILGASAGVGLLTVERALQRGHHVTTLSRSTETLPQHERLTAIKGSATKLADVKQAMANADAVIVALGTGKSTKATTLYTDAAAALIEAQRELGTPAPFIVLTGFGAGESGKYHNFVMGLIFKFILNKVYANKTVMEEMIAQSPLHWEFVRPGVLNDKPLSEQYKVQTNYYAGMKVGGIARADVADFMVKQAERPTLLGQAPALSQR